MYGQNHIMLPLILILTITLPTAWLASEFQNRRWLRVLLGCSAIAMCFLVAFGVGTLEHLNANSWYGFASKNLIDTTIQELEQGNTDKVVEELKELQKQFQPTYENRARYDKLVEGYASRLGHGQ